MEDRLLGIWDYLKSIPLSAKVVTGGIVTGVLAVVILRRKRSSKKEYPKNTVILYQLGRGPHVPGISPFCMKLETYHRMAKISYQNDHNFQKSPKGKFPWIDYNGEAIADSLFSIKFINKTFGIHFHKGLSSEEKACAYAWQTVLEEHTFWILALNRFQYEEDAGIIRYLPISKLLIPLMRHYVRTCGFYQGMGRHSKEEVYELLDEDLQALSDFLGDKKFIAGDNPCEEDAAIFGLLAQFYWESLRPN